MSLQERQSGCMRLPLAWWHVVQLELSWCHAESGGRSGGSHAPRKLPAHPGFPGHSRTHQACCALLQGWRTGSWEKPPTESATPWAPCPCSPSPDPVEVLIDLPLPEEEVAPDILEGLGESGALVHHLVDLAPCIALCEQQGGVARGRLPAGIPIIQLPW